MSVSLVAHTSQAGSSSTAALTTGSGIDTTGATLLVGVGVGENDFNNNAWSDSLSNTWIQGPSQRVGAATTGLQLTIYYAIPTAFGAGQTFTFDGGVRFKSMVVAAFSGATWIPPFNSNFTTASISTVSSGALGAAPQSQKSSWLYLACLGLNNGTGISIGSSFNITDTVTFGSTSHYGVSLAYKESSSSENPAWSWTTNATATLAFLLAFPEGPGTSVPSVEVVNTAIFAAPMALGY